MMKKSIFYLMLIIFSFTFVGVSAQEDTMKLWYNHGKINKKSFKQKIPFKYINGYIFVEITQNGEKYNFLFDSGAESTIIDKSIIDKFKFKEFGRSEASGPLVKQQKLKTLLVSKIDFSELSFLNVGAISIDLSFTEAKFCNRIYGVIGSNIIHKAIWQIDYKNQLITITDTIEKTPVDGHIKLHTITPKYGWGTEAVNINFDGFTSKFDVDSGNGRFALVASPDLFYKKLKNKSIKRIRYGTKKENYLYKLKFNSLKIGNFKVNNQVLNLDPEVGKHQLIGNRFFENYILTLDFRNHAIYLEPNKNNSINNDNFFDLKLVPNYKTNKIVIKTGVKEFLKKNKINIGDIVLKINDVRVDNLSKAVFCNYINTEFNPLFLKDTAINIEVKSNKKNRKISINKLNKL